MYAEGVPANLKHCLATALDLPEGAKSELVGIPNVEFFGDLWDDMLSSHYMDHFLVCFLSGSLPGF